MIGMFHPANEAVPQIHTTLTAQITSICKQALSISNRSYSCRVELANGISEFLTQQRRDRRRDPASIAPPI